MTKPTLGKLTIASIPAIEKATGCGIGELSRRVFAGQFTHRDLEVIKVAMVVAGNNPDHVSELTEAFVNSLTLSEAHNLAVKCLEHLWFGPAVQSTASEGDSQ